MSDLAIVVVAYNRLDGVKRLLQSLLCADYAEDAVDLIISIDFSGTYDVIDYANQFEWPYGAKNVCSYPKRMGLRNHILHCGEFVDDYEAIAVLEDDLYVSPGFYYYMKEAVEFYKNDDRIAGISLYNHLWNVNVNRNFQAATTQFDTFFLQLAQSWGQVWLRKQWREFSEWYHENKDRGLEEGKYPDFMRAWPESSWLKYHIMYCVEKKKYFVYPYMALTTCFSDEGEHTAVHSNLFQIPFMTDIKSNYHLATLNQEAVRYDVFFERQGLGKYIGIDDNELCVNLYGTKRDISERYLLTTQKCHGKIIKSYALELRPHEMNVIDRISGNDIFLYDVGGQQWENKAHYNRIEHYEYYQKIQKDWKLMLRIAIRQLCERLVSIIKK